MKQNIQWKNRGAVLQNMMNCEADRKKTGKIAGETIKMKTKMTTRGIIKRTVAEWARIIR